MCNVFLLLRAHKSLGADGAHIFNSKSTSPFAKRGVVAFTRYPMGLPPPSYYRGQQPPSSYYKEQYAGTRCPRETLCSLNRRDAE